MFCTSSSRALGFVELSLFDAVAGDAQAIRSVSCRRGSLKPFLNGHFQFNECYYFIESALRIDKWDPLIEPFDHDRVAMGIRSLRNLDQFATIPVEGIHSTLLTIHAAQVRCDNQGRYVSASKNLLKVCRLAL